MPRDRRSTCEGDARTMVRNHVKRFLICVLSAALAVGMMPAPRVAYAENNVYYTINVDIDAEPEGEGPDGAEDSQSSQGDQDDQDGQDSQDAQDAQDAQDDQDAQDAQDAQDSQGVQDDQNAQDSQGDRSGQDEVSAEDNPLSEHLAMAFKRAQRILRSAQEEQQSEDITISLGDGGVKYPSEEQVDLLLFKGDVTATVTFVTDGDTNVDPKDVEIMLVQGEGQKVLDPVWTSASDASVAISSNDVSEGGSAHVKAVWTRADNLGDPEQEAATVTSTSLSDAFAIQKNVTSSVGGASENGKEGTSPEDSNKFFFAKDVANPLVTVTVSVPDRFLKTIGQAGQVGQGEEAEEAGRLASMSYVEVEGSEVDGGEAAPQKYYEWKRSDDGVYTCEVKLSQFGSYTIGGHVYDWAENDSAITPTTFTLVSDQEPPILSVSYSSDSGRMMGEDGATYYTKELEATIAVTEENFDASAIRVESDVLESQEGSSPVSWTDKPGDASTHIAIVKFSSNGEHWLKVSGSDKAGNALIADDSGSTAVSSGVYENNDIRMLVNPELEVSFDPVATAGTEGLYFNTSAVDGHALTVTVTIKDFRFEAGKVRIVQDGSPVEWGSSDEGTSEPEEPGELQDPETPDVPETPETADTTEDPEGDEGDGDPVVMRYTKELVFEEGAGHSLEITSLNDDRKFVGAEGTNVGDGTYELAGFTVDGTPPVVAVSLQGRADGETPAEPILVDPGSTTFFGGTAEASVKVTDLGISVSESSDFSIEVTSGESSRFYKLKASSPEVAGSEDVDPGEAEPDSMHTYVNAEEITFEPAQGEEKVYVLTVSGSDLAGVSMVPQTYTVVIDQKPPEIQLSYEPVDGGSAGAIVRGEEGAPETHFFSDAVKVKVTIAESNFKAESIEVTLNDGEPIGLDWDPPVGESALAHSATFDVSDVNTLTAIKVYAQDGFGNHAAASEKPDVEEHVYIDDKAPVLSVKYSPHWESIDDANTTYASPVTRYYKGAADRKVTVTVTLEDDYLPVTGGDTVVAHIGGRDVELNPPASAEGEGEAPASSDRIAIAGTTTALTGTLELDASQDATYEVEVIGSDLAGKGFTAMEGESDTNAAIYPPSEDFEGYKNRYRSMIVVDATAPQMEVSYVQVGTGRQIVPGADGTDTQYSNEDMTFTAAIDDAHLIEADSVNVMLVPHGADPAGESAKALAIRWLEPEGSVHKAQFLVGKTTEGSFDLSIMAEDRVGNSTAYALPVVIDTTAPELTVSYDGTPSYLVAGTSLDSPEVRYYGKSSNLPIVPSFEVRDANIDADHIVATVEGATVPEFAQDADSQTWRSSASGLSGEGQYTVSVAARDLAGNVLKADVPRALFENPGGETAGAQYRCWVVIDKTRPYVSASYQSGSTSAQLPNGGSLVYTNQAATVTATINEVNFSADLVGFNVNGSAEASAWNSGTGNSHTMTVSRDTAQGTEETYEFEITGKDLAQNDLTPDGEDSPSVKYTSAIKIDKIAPTVRIDYVRGSDVQENVEQPAQAAETRYYDGSVIARITVVDTSMGDGIRVNGRAIPLDRWTVQNDSTYVYEVPYSKEGDYTLTVDGEDLAGNALVSADQATLVASGSFSTTVVVDTSKPVLSVVWGDTPTNGKYYKANRAARISIEELNFDPARIRVDGKPTAESDWSGSGTSWTYLPEVAYREDGTYSLRVEGTDRAGGVLVGVDDRSPAKAVDAEGVYVADEFVVDKTAPQVLVRLGQPLVRTIDSVDYFAASAHLPVTVMVADANFDPANDETGTTSLGISGSVSASYSAENWADSTYTVTYSENNLAHRASGLTVVICDLAGNTTAYQYGDARPTLSTAEQAAGKASTVDSEGTQLRGDAFSLDITAPVVVPTDGNTGNIPTEEYSSDRSTYDSSYLFFKDKTTLRITVNDAVGIHVLELDSDGVSEGNPYVFANDEASSNKTSRTIDIPLVEGVGFTSNLYLYAEDNANNVRRWRINPANGTVTDVTGSNSTNTPLYGNEDDLYPLSVIQDTVRPVLKLSGVSAGAYYNEPRTVRLAVSEFNFHYLRDYDKSQQAMTVTRRAGDATLAESSWTPMPVKAFKELPDGEKGVDYYNETILAEDGHYEIEANLSDPAKNAAKTVKVGEFTIDRTPPTVSVTFDNNNAVNGIYYPAGRTATIVVTEHNFSADRFTVDTTGTVGRWATDGDEHTLTVEFLNDGRHTLTISGADLADNAMRTYVEPEFVVDLIQPTITFAGVGAGEAYNGVVMPSVLYSDEANFDANGTSCTVTGTKNGTVSLPSSLESSGENNATLNFSDLGELPLGLYDASVDDIYTLEASVTDMAGNSAQDSITFSVNRFGSNYRIIEGEAHGGNEGYLLEAQDILIEEVNVSGCDSEQHGVTVTSGANVKHLELNGPERGKGYTIEEQTSDDDSTRGWASYIYRIAAGNFDSDGRYYVTISSDDRATNKNTSSNYYSREADGMAKAEVSFILDTTDPVITNLNLASNETYNGESRRCTFAVIDNLGVQGIEVLLDGDSVEPVDEGYGSYSFEVPALSFQPRDIAVRAQDLAGRTVEEGANGFHVTNDILELHLPFVIGGGAGALAIVGGAVYLFGFRLRRLV